MPLVACTTADVHVNVIDDLAKSSGPPVPTGVKLLSKIETVYKGLVALIVVLDAARTGTIKAVTDVP